jgi:hypothetical protein
MTHRERAALFYEEWEADNKLWLQYPEVMINFAEHCLRNQEEADLKHFYYWVKANKLIGLSPEEKVRVYLKEQ